MSGFSAEWLSLREAADHRARDPGLRDAVAACLAARGAATIVDLACGSGSNLRGLAPFVGAAQTWRLVDHDPALLDAARKALIDWADASAEPLRLVKDGVAIDVTFRQADLATGVGAALGGDIDLVTAAAFFDLVSQEWIAGFCEELARRRLPLYAVLTYSGEEVWRPSHAADAEALAAFHAHQARDKGCGPSAGPRAPEFL
jgi:SAM-dependent methyltransferase